MYRNCENKRKILIKNLLIKFRIYPRLVLRKRFELSHPKAPPPQDGMSTNFTTAAFA